MTVPRLERKPVRRAPGRDRDHQQPGRRRAILLRYTETEFAAIAAAARDAGLTPSGYTAEAALATATHTQPPSTEPWRAVLLELMEARAQARRIGANVNQAARQLNSTGEPPVWLDHVMTMTARAVFRLDHAASAVTDVAGLHRTQGRA
jgi:hypothetical protein